MRIKLVIIILILLNGYFFFKKDGFDYHINKDYDFVCVFPPYTPKLVVLEELKKYSSDLKDDAAYKESMDDGIFTYFFIKDNEIISSGEEIVRNNLVDEYGCLGR